MTPSNDLENKTPSDSFSEPPLEYNQGHMPLTNQGSL